MEINESSESTSGVASLTPGQLAAVFTLAFVAVAAGMALTIAVFVHVERVSPRVFDRYARLALEQGDFDRVEAICQAATAYPALSEGHLGRISLYQGLAALGRDQSDRALEYFRTAARRWNESPWNATLRDRDELASSASNLGLIFLASADQRRAIDAFSAAAIATDQPVDYLYTLTQSLTRDEATTLWPDAPYLVLEDFEDPDAPTFHRWVEEQGRQLLRANVVDDQAFDGNRSAALEISTGAGDGRSWYRIPTRIRLDSRPFGIRSAIRVEDGTPAVAVAAFNLPRSRFSFDTRDPISSVSPGDWFECAIEPSTIAAKLDIVQRQGQKLEDGVIVGVGIGFTGGPAKLRMDRVVLFLPAAEAGAEPGRG